MPLTAVAGFTRETALRRRSFHQMDFAGCLHPSFPKLICIPSGFFLDHGQRGVQWSEVVACGPVAAGIFLRCSPGIPSAGPFHHSICCHRRCYNTQAGGVWYAEGGNRHAVSNSCGDGNDYPCRCWPHHGWAETHVGLLVGLPAEGCRNGPLPMDSADV